MVYKINLKLTSKNNEIFTILESFGDFLIVSKDEYILHTKKGKLSIKNKLNKILSNNESISIIPVLKENINGYPDVVKGWILLDDVQSKIKKISPKEVEKEALTRLHSFIGAFEEELKKEQSQ